jgi:hypothetical protein
MTRDNRRYGPPIPSRPAPESTLVTILTGIATIALAGAVLFLFWCW